MQEVLIVSNYFPPETGAASNRIATLANGLKSNGWKVSVLCPLPNYPDGKIFEGYRNKLYQKTIENDITIYRTWVFPSVSKNPIVRIISMLSFSFSLSLFLIFSRTPKKIIVQSPPLFVSFFSVLCCKLKRKKVILNVSDLWPLAAKELGVMKDGFGYRMAQKIERFNYRNSILILGQSNEICTHINKLTSNKTVLYRNYPKFSINENIESINNEKIHIVYAGLLGVAQGIVTLCKNINLPKNVVLDIYGNGAEKNELLNFIKENPEKNIIFHGELTRSELHKVLTTKADYTLIPLINRIYGSVPSKIFEMSNLGLPIIYMGGGEGGEVVSELNLGYVINPSDFTSLNTLIPSLEKTTKNRKNEIIQIAKTNFSFEKQLEEIINVLEGI